MAPPDLILNGYPLLIRHKGVGAYTLRLIRGLLHHAPELRFRVLIPESLLETASDLPSGICEVIRGSPPIRRSIAQDIYWNNRVGRWAAQHYPDAVFHSPAEFWSFSRPRKTVVTLHDCIYRWFPRLQGGIIRKWWWRATERYARGVRQVLTVSNVSRQDLVALAGIPREKIEILYPWIDAVGYRAQAARDRETVRQKHQLPARFFLYFGGFNVNKNVPFLVEGYAAAARRAQLPPLVIAGYIPDNLRLAVGDVWGAIHAAGLPAGQILTPGFIAEEDVPGLLAASDLLIYPSRYEGFGYPPVEAMAAGTPVVVANAASLREVVRSPHCRFELDDPSELESKLVEVAGNPGRFQCSLPSEFTASFGVSRYLQLLGLERKPFLVCCA